VSPASKQRRIRMYYFVDRVVEKRRRHDDVNLTQQVTPEQVELELVDLLRIGNRALSQQVQTGNVQRHRRANCPVPIFQTALRSTMQAS
jgi:hypothetical protein